jgi:ubiquinone biosynthesis protein COQ9
MTIEQDKITIFESGLKHVPFDGWSLSTFEQAAVSIGYEAAIVEAFFPKGDRDLIDYFAQWADRQMMDALYDTDASEMRIRDRVKICLQMRISILNPHKEAVNLAFKKLLHPQNARMAASITWRTADVIWNWAGDTAQDYNYYTKRGLLSGVISTTMTYWLQDKSDNHAKTLDFMDRRIENVLFIGKNAGKIISPLARAADRFIVPNMPFNKKKV